jgi:hypothetical protein
MAVDGITDTEVGTKVAGGIIQKAAVVAVEGEAAGAQAEAVVGAEAAVASRHASSPSRPSSSDFVSLYRRRRRRRMVAAERPS